MMKCRRACLYTAFHEDSGGVSESLYVPMSLPYLPPLTALPDAMDSSSAMSSGVSFTDRAPIFWLKFSILVVPGMGHTSSPWWCTQASASCDGVHCFLAAISLTRSKRCLLCSRFSGWNLGRYCDNRNTCLSIRSHLINKTNNQGITVYLTDDTWLI